MAVLSHNRGCDARHWFGELSLNKFEQYVLNDDIMQPPLFDAYDEVITHSWSAFIIDNSFS